MLLSSLLVLQLINYIFLVRQSNAETVFKMTAVQCEELTPDAIVINTCRIRAVRRGISKIYLNVTLLDVVKQTDFHIEVLKKAYGFKPMGINTTFDGCEYLRRKSNPIANIMYRMLKPYTNVNHTCPYAGNILIDGYYPKFESLKLPIPRGEYRVQLKIDISKIPAFNIFVFFEFSPKEYNAK